MNLFHALIYQPGLNKVIRNVNYLLSPVLPKKIRIHPSGKIRVKIDGIEPIYFKTNQTSFLTRELFWKGGAGFEYSTIFVALAKKFDFFMDIGANIGYYSILATTSNPQLKAISFEPSEGPMVYALENAKINKVDARVLIEPIALSDQEGNIDFYNLINPKFPNIYNLSGEHNTGTKKERKSNKITVKTTTLDTYVSKKAIKEVGFIKIDTEGTEHLILKGGSHTIQTLRPIIICETLFDNIEDKLENFFKPLNYLMYNHVNDILQLVHTIKRTEDDGIRNCFFVPKEKVELIEEFL